MIAVFELRLNTSDVKHLIPVSFLFSGSALWLIPLAESIAHIDKLSALDESTPHDVVWYAFIPAIIGTILIGFGIYFSFRSYSEK